MALFLNDSIPPIFETVSSEERPYDLFPVVVLLGLRVDGDTDGGAGAGGGGGNTNGGTSSRIRAEANINGHAVGGRHVPSNGDCVSSDEEAGSFGANETFWSTWRCRNPGQIRREFTASSTNLWRADGESTAAEATGVRRLYRESTESRWQASGGLPAGFRRAFGGLSAGFRRASGELMSS